MPDTLMLIRMTDAWFPPFDERYLKGHNRPHAFAIRDELTNAFYKGYMHQLSTTRSPSSI